MVNGVMSEILYENKDIKSVRFVNITVKIE